MPLIVITGIPSSGKTKRAIELRDYFLAEAKEVHIVSENDEISRSNFDKNQFYSDSTKEKIVRSFLKSEVLRLITPKNVVILDGLNYIKGYRYELFCGTKANKVAQCTVHVGINQDEAWNWNTNRKDAEQYARNTFDALVMRYEEPKSKDRWDSPLFVVYPTGNLDKEAIKASLFQGKPVKPNMSTQNPPLSSTNFLYELDQITKKIVDDCGNCLRLGTRFHYKHKDGESVNLDVSNLNIQQLMLLKRQYITYAKLHPPEVQDIERLFVQYLITSIK